MENSTGSVPKPRLFWWTRRQALRRWREFYGWATGQTARNREKQRRLDEWVNAEREAGRPINLDGIIKRRNR